MQIYNYNVNSQNNIIMVKHFVTFNYILDRHVTTL